MASKTLLSSALRRLNSSSTCRLRCSPSSRPFSLSSFLRQQQGSVNSDAKATSTAAKQSSKANIAEGLAAEHLARIPKESPPPNPKSEGSSSNSLAIFLSIFSAASIGSAYYLGRPGSDVPKSITSSAGDDAASQYSARALYRLSNLFSFFSEPPIKKLLHDPLPEEYQRPYTLVISLDDTLVHTKWDPQHGFRIVKRPGVEKFLAYMSQFYEIVIFASSSCQAALPVIDQLDRLQATSYRLGREHTRWINGKTVKDLSYLNRDLSKVIIMDIDEDAFSQQPENAIKLEKWAGDMNDTKLLDFIPFLQTLAVSGISDVRPVLATYTGYDIPTRFAENQKRYVQKMQEEYEAQLAAAPKNQSSGFSLSSLFGRTSTPAASGPPNLDVIQQSKMMQEDFMAQLENHKADIEQQQKAMLEEQEQMMAQFKNKKYTLWKLMTEGLPQPPQHAGAGFA